MSACRDAASDRKKPTGGRRVREILAWLLPSACLVLVPKCPACLAAHVTLWTGLGLSLSTATSLRWMLLFLGVASLLVLIAERLDRQRVSIRHRRGERRAGRPFSRTLAAPRLPLYVRARVQGRVSLLLGDRGRVRRPRRPPGKPRRHAGGGVALRPLAKLQAYQRRMGWTISLGEFARPTTSTSTFTSRSPRSNNAGRASITTIGAAATRWT